MEFTRSTPERTLTFHIGSFNQMSLDKIGALCGYDQSLKSDQEIHHWTDKTWKKLIVQTFITVQYLDQNSLRCNGDSNGSDDLPHVFQGEMTHSLTLRCRDFILEVGLSQ